MNKIICILVLFLINLSACSGSSGGSSGGVPSYNSTHPKLFLTPAVITDLQAKVSANDPDWLELKARADVLVTYNVPAYDRNATPANSIYYAYQGLPWLEAAQVLGLAYKMTSDTAYAAKLKQLIDVINTAGTTPIASVDSGYPTRSVAFAMALMYDWLYDYLDATTKSAMIATINSYYASYQAGTGWYSINGPAYDNYFGGHLLGFGTCALATSGDNPTATAMLADIRGKWDSVVVPAFTTGGFAGGANLESYNYGPNHFVRLLQFAIALQTATGEDIYSSYGNNIAVNLLYNLKPNRWQSTDEGDFSGDYTGIMPTNLAIVLAGFLSGSTGDQMAYFYSNMAATPYTTATNTIQKADVFTRFLFKRSRTSEDYRLTRSLVHRSAGDEHIFARSDWSDSAVWTSYMAGNIRWTGHQMSTAGHIALQRGNDYLLVSSGQWKGSNGITGSPSLFTTASWTTNTLFFDDFGEYLYTGGIYVGGQMSTFPDTNLILNYETTSNYTYVKSDHTNAYDKRADSRNDAIRSLRYFHRNFVYLPSNQVVVYDRIKALKDTYTKKLYWHLNKQGQPVDLGGKITSSTVGSSKIFVASVYPTTTTVTFAHDLNSSSETITPRIEIADSIISTDFTPLTVFVADTSSASTPTISGIETAGMVGTQIGSSAPNIVIFAKDGSTQTSVSYTASYTGTGVHLLLDMEPGSYTVTKGITSLGTYTATAQGALRITSSGGGAFVINKL